MKTIKVSKDELISVTPNNNGLSPKECEVVIEVGNQELLNEFIELMPINISTFEFKLSDDETLTGDFYIGSILCTDKENNTHNITLTSSGEITYTNNTENQEEEADVTLVTEKKKTKWLEVKCPAKAKKLNYVMVNGVKFIRAK